MLKASPQQILDFAKKYSRIGSSNGELYGVDSNGETVKLGLSVFRDSFHGLAQDGKLTYNNDYTYSLPSSQFSDPESAVDDLRSRHGGPFFRERAVQFADGEATAGISVGDWVSVKKDMGRRSKVKEITTNSLGTVIFVLADGGRFDRNEIEPTSR